MTLSTLLRLALVALATLTLTTSVSSAQSALFAPLDGARVSLDAQQAQFLTSLETERGVDAVDLVTAEASRLGSASELRIALPDTEVVLRTVASMPRRSGHLSWVGRSGTGPEAAWAFLVTRDGQITGEVHHGGYVYPVRPLTGGVHAVARKSMADYQMHPDDYAAFLEADRPRLEMLMQAEAEASPARRSAATTVIDVLVPYTEDVDAALADPVALAQSFVDYTNTAYSNSDIDLELNMVNAYETPYTYSGSLSTDLGRLRNGTDGNMDEAHRIRESYGADLVALITGTHTFGVCGIGYVNAGYGTGFSANSAGCGASTFAHEVGHNLGSNHDASTDNDTTPGDGVNDPVYSYGRGYVNDTGKWGTVMAYNAACTGQLCQIIPYFSNPNVNYDDTTSPEADGPAGDATLADNARVHRERMVAIAAFGTGGAPPVLTTSAASLTASVAAGGTATRQVTVSNTAAGGANDLDWFARVQSVDVPGARRASPGNCATGETGGQSSFGSYFDVESGGRELGQSFAATCRGVITSISPKIYYNGAPSESWEATLRIYRGDGTETTELASGTVSHTNGATGIVNVPVTLSTPFEVVEGETYTWFLDLTSGRTSMLLDGGNPDPNGTAHLSFDGDPTRTAAQSWDQAYLVSYDEPAATWLEVTPVTGTEAAGASSAFTVAFDATGLDPGTYTAEIAVLSGDPNNFEQTVPVALTVVSGALAVDDGFGWRILAVPFDGVTVGTLADQNLVQGTPDSYPGAGTNLFTSYDGSAWAGAGAHTEAVAPGTGFLWYLYDEDVDPDTDDPDNSVGVALPSALVGSGSEPSSDVSVSLHADGDGWNLLGNPFLLDLDVSGVNTWTGASDLQSFIGQVWQCTPNAGSPVECVGSYTTTTLLGDVVPAWHGVFFDASAAGSLTIPTSARGATARRSATRMLSFELASADGGAIDRAATVVFRDGAEAGWDGWDAEKLASLASPSVQIAFGGERDGEALLKAQDSRPLDPATLEIPVHVASSGAGGALVLTWPRLDGLPDDWGLRLIDHEAGVTVDLRAADRYVFEVTETAVRSAALPGAGARLGGDAPRFTLGVQTANAVATETDAPAETWLGTPYPNPSRSTATVRFGLAEAGEARLTLVDLLGREVAVLAEGDHPAGKAQAALPVGRLAPGLYVVRLEAGDRLLTRRAVVVR